MSGQRGFTLLEVLVALTLFALLMALAYAALGPAGEGFRMLAEQRGEVGATQLAARQLRQDVAMLAVSNDAAVLPLEIRSDRRGDRVFDTLTLTTFELGQPGVSQVRWALDESDIAAGAMLVRTSSSPWQRSGESEVVWQLGKASSFDVELLDADGRWRDEWSYVAHQPLPKALRITLRRGELRQQWEMPIELQPLADPYAGQQP